MRVIPSFDDALGQHMRGADTVRSDLYRLLSSVEEAALHFDQEIDSIVVRKRTREIMIWIIYIDISLNSHHKWIYIYMYCCIARGWRRGEDDVQEWEYGKRKSCSNQYGSE